MQSTTKDTLPIFCTGEFLIQSGNLIAEDDDDNLRCIPDELTEGIEDEDLLRILRLAHIGTDPIEGHCNFSQMIPNATATQIPSKTAGHLGQNGYHQTDSQYTDVICKTTNTTVEAQSNTYSDIPTVINQNTNQGIEELDLNPPYTNALSPTAPQRTDTMYGSVPACSNYLSTEQSLLNLDSKHHVKNRHHHAKSKSFCESEIRTLWSVPTSNDSQQSMIQFEDPLQHNNEPQIDATQQIKRRNSDQMTTINCIPPQGDAYHSQTSYSSYNIPSHIIDSPADYSNFDVNGKNQHQTYQSTPQTSFSTSNKTATEYKEEIEWLDDGDFYQKDTDSNAKKGARSTQTVSSTSDWSIYSPFSPAHHGRMQTGSAPECSSYISTEQSLLNLDSKHHVKKRHHHAKSKSLCESEIRTLWNVPTSNDSQQSMIQFEDPLQHNNEPQIDATQQIKRRNSDQMTTIKSETKTAGFDSSKYSIPCSNYPTSSINHFQTNMCSTSDTIKDTQKITVGGNTMYNTKSNIYSGGQLTEQPYVINCIPPQGDAYHSHTSYSPYNILSHIIDSPSDYSNFDVNGMNQHQTYQSTSQTSFSTQNTTATEYKEDIEWSDDGDSYKKDAGLLICTDSNAIKGARSTQAASSTSDWSIYSPFSPAHHGKMQTGQSFRQKKLKRGCRLWEFIRNLLLDPSYNPSHIRWEDRNEGTFRLMQTKSIARIWGMKKGNDAMNYEKLSRAMRYYYKRQVFQPVLGKRLVYRFGPRATGWKEDE